MKLANPQLTRVNMLSAVQVLLALLLPLANAAIGPVGDLPITSVEIAPDGVSRP